MFLLEWQKKNNLCHINDQTYNNETSLCSIECISDNDTVFNKGASLYTDRVERTCREHYI